MHPCLDLWVERLTAQWCCAAPCKPAATHHQQLLRPPHSALAACLPCRAAFSYDTTLYGGNIFALPGLEAWIK